MRDATLAIGFRISHVYRQGPQTFPSRSHAPPAIPRLLCHNVRTCGQSVVLTLATCQSTDRAFRCPLPHNPDIGLLLWKQAPPFRPITQAQIAARILQNFAQGELAFFIVWRWSQFELPKGQNILRHCTSLLMQADSPKEPHPALSGSQSRYFCVNEAQDAS